MKEAATLVPALRGYENLQPAFEINASGPADRLDVQLNAREKESVRSPAISPSTSSVQRGPSPARCKRNTSTSGRWCRGSMFKTDVTGHATMDLALPADGRPLAAGTR